MLNDNAGYSRKTYHSEKYMYIFIYLLIIPQDEDQKGFSSLSIVGMIPTLTQLELQLSQGS